MKNEKVKNKRKLVLPVEAAISNFGQASLPTTRMAIKGLRKWLKMWWVKVLSECMAHVKGTKLGLIQSGWKNEHRVQFSKVSGNSVMTEELWKTMELATNSILHSQHPPIPKVKDASLRHFITCLTYIHFKCLYVLTCSHFMYCFATKRCRYSSKLSTNKDEWIALEYSLSQ